MSQKKAIIYQVGVRVTWKKMRGKSYVNMWRGSENDPFLVTTIHKNVEDMTKDVVLITNIMKQFGAANKSTQDFHIVAEYDRKEIGVSSFHLESE